MLPKKFGRRQRYGVEYEPRYVDVAVRRWEAFTKMEAILEDDGRTFAEVGAGRSEPPAHQHSQPTSGGR